MSILPFIEMDDLNLRIVSTIINFLRSQLNDETSDQDKTEGLEVAIQCLESIYDMSSVHRRTNEPTLRELYKFYIQNPHLNRRESSTEEKAEAERLKVDANFAMGESRYVEALLLYTRAIDCNPRNPVYYCNRAAAKSRMNDHMAAVRDCSIALELDPGYGKAYGRLGLAYCGLELFVRAIECYKKAHELDPDNEGFKGNLELARMKVRESWSPEEDPPPPPPQPTIDLGTLLGNSHLLSLASQVLAGPTVQSFGYTLARDMSDVLDGLRQSASPRPASPPENREPPGQDNL